MSALKCSRSESNKSAAMTRTLSRLDILHGSRESSRCGCEQQESPPDGNHKTGTIGYESAHMFQVEAHRFGKSMTNINDSCCVVPIYSKYHFN